MHSEVLVKTDGQEFKFDLQGQAPMALDEAQAWLDAEFNALECEPLRASGKLLRADKVLVLARDAGPARLADPAWGPRFAAATCAALGKSVVRLDTGSMSAWF